MTQDIGTRMKSYESNRRLANGAVIIRVDGKSFHTWTRQVNAIKPYDLLVTAAMEIAVKQCADEMQGFKLAYTQSDEATFLLTNTGEKEQQWFGGKLDKLVSITASMFTYYFNTYWNEYALQYFVNAEHGGYKKIPAFFDARAFNIPIEDAANCFYWRQLDWRRNSVVMLGRAHFNHKEMIGKSANQVKEMLNEIGVSWEEQYNYNKYGLFYDGNRSMCKFLNYDQINELAGISVT